jgi:predicted nucleotidyltransferase
LFALEVGARRRVHASLRDRDPMERAVELTVAAAIEAVALVLAGAGVEWCDAGVSGELRVGAEALDRADLTEQLRGAERSAAW